MKKDQSNRLSLRKMVMLYKSIEPIIILNILLRKNLVIYTKFLKSAHKTYESCSSTNLKKGSSWLSADPFNKSLAESHLDS